MKDVNQNLLERTVLADNGEQMKGELDKVLEGKIKPVADEFTELEVKFELSSLVSRLAECYSSHYDDLIAIADAGKIEAPNAEELNLFFQYVTALKLDYIAHKYGRESQFKNARQVLSETYVPDFFGLFLCNIGVVDVQDLEVRLFPILSQKVDVDFNLVTKVSKILKRLKVSGIAPNVHTVALSTLGNINVMTFLHVEEEIYSNSVTIHPVYALMGSLFKSVVNDYIHEQMWRVSYGGYNSILRVLSDNILQGRM